MPGWWQPTTMRWSSSTGSVRWLRNGERLDAPVLGLYEVRDGRFARAEMFHFDTAAIVGFLERARG